MNNTLPVCRHRGTRRLDGRFPCRSPKVIHLGDGNVSADQCRGCALADKIGPVETSLIDCPGCPGRVRLKVPTSVGGRMRPFDLLQFVRSLGVSVQARGRELHYDPASKVSTLVRRMIEDSKEELLKLVEQEATQAQSVEQVLDDIRRRDVPLWPKGWQFRPEVEEAHRQLVAEVVSNLDHARPLAGSGRGIVTCGGGATYFTAAWVMVSLLRWHGCNLPVEWWHLGKHEMDHRMRALAESLGNVRVVDAVEVSRHLAEPARMLGGWESKIFALLHSSFEETLLLDADQVPVSDPTYLFDDQRYRDTGAVLWPDLRNRWGFDIEEQAFRTVGLPVPAKTMANFPRPTAYRPVESGQVLVNRSKRYKELLLCWHIAEHADYWYRGSTQRDGANLIYGDKSAFFLGFERLGNNYVMPPDCSWRGDSRGGIFLQHDLDGNLIFQHRAQPPTKWSLHGRNQDCGIAGWDYCMEALRHLRARWIGHPWDWGDQDEMDRAHATALIGRRFHLFRSSQPPRRIRLLEGGKVQGGSEHEHHWTMAHHGADKILIFASTKRATAILGMQGECGWQNVSESVRLTASPPEGWQTPDEFGLEAFGSIVYGNEYHLPERLDGAAILDIGAHAGNFAEACMRRGAQRVFCVEPAQTNLQCLRHNMAKWGPAVTIIEGAAARCDRPRGRCSLLVPCGAMTSGGWTVHEADQEGEIQTIPFDEIVDQVLREAKRIDCLKLDCEGSEFPILYTSQRLDRIDTIRGEYHLGNLQFFDGEYTLDGLVEILQAHDFRVEVIPTVPGLGYFFAERQA